MVARREILQTLCTTVGTRAAGRSIYAMTEAQKQLLREEGFRWEVTARCFEVSSVHYGEEEEEENVK